MGTDQQHQPLNRRRFLQTTAAFAVTVGLGAKPSMLAASGMTRKRSIAELHFADFAALLGQPFRVYVADSLPQVVQLAAVNNRAHTAYRAASPRYEWFSLAFSGPKAQALPQGTHTFAHPKVGYFDLFVVPTMAVAHEERAIAIINRI